MPETAEILRNLKAGKLAEKVWLTFNHKVILVSWWIFFCVYRRCARKLFQ